MTEPLDLEAIRARHRPSEHSMYCVGDSLWWPCDAVRLADEVEWLTANNKRPSMMLRGQSEAPTVFDGGKE